MTINYAGVLIYKKENNKLKILVSENKGRFEDIGTQIDNDILSLAYHIEKETNEQIKSINIIDRLKLAPYIYFPKYNYIIYFIEASKDEKILKRDDFSEHSFYNGSIRYIGWMPRDKLFSSSTLKYKINHRLQSKSIINKIIDIEKQYKYKHKMF